MKFFHKALVTVACLAFVGVSAWVQVHYFWPDGQYEDEIVVVKIYDHRACQIEGGTEEHHHATVKNKKDGTSRIACYAEDKASGLMLFFTEGGGVAMAHRSMF